jgi:uncharacterized protein YlaN (UPF0358 family)
MFVYFKVSFMDVEVIHKETPLTQDTIKEEKILKALSSTQKAEDELPTKELYYSVNLNFLTPVNIVYKTIIDDLDKYQLFGIEQILKLNKIRYSIIKSKKGKKLFMNFSTKSSANRVVALMKRYNINIKMEKIFIKG